MFERTSCSCELCQVGCRTMPGAAAVGDIEKISEHVKGRVDPDWIVEHFEASSGAKTFNPLTGEIKEIPTIVPSRQPDGSCVFYKDGRCAIHEVAPFCCSQTDSHMTSEEWAPKSQHYLSSIKNSFNSLGSYWMWWFLLVHEGKMAPPTEQRRAAFEAEYKRVERERSNANRD